MSKIPNKLHFVNFNKDPKNPRKMELSHFVCMLSAIDCMKPEQVFIHGHPIMSGEYWEEFNRRIHWTGVEYEDFEELNGKKVEFIHHKGDYVRCKALYEHGGHYTDMDSLFLRDINEIVDAKYGYVFMGEERICGGKLDGLATGIMSAVPKAKLFEEMIWHYENDYKPEEWTYNSVRMTKKLWEENPSLITPLPYDRYYRLSYVDSHLPKIFKDPAVLYPRAYSIHLWESISTKKGYLPMSKKDALEGNSIFCNVAKLYL